MKVVVKTGRVAVYTQDQATLNTKKETYKLEGIVLTPNQQIVFSPAETETHLTKSLIENPVPVEQAAQQQAFAFKRAPIAEVFTALEQSYGIKIVFDEEVMRTCSLTASFYRRTPFR